MTGALALPSNGLAVGTSQLVVSGGYVGIGTTSPAQKLEVVGYGRLSHAVAPYLDFNHSGGGANQKIRRIGTMNGVMVFDKVDDTYTTSTEQMRIDVNGNVGIGLTNPSEKLEVAGNIKATQLCIGADCRSSWPSGAGGSVTSVTSANADIGVATTTTTPVLTLNTGTGANQILKLNALSEIPTVSGVNLTNLNASNLASGTVPPARFPAFTGDVTSTAGTSALTLATVPVSKGGTAVTSFGANKIVGTNGTGTAMTSYSCGLNEVIKFDGSGNAGCASVSTLLGYAPANGANYVAKAGDTMTGGLTINTGVNDGLRLNNGTLNGVVFNTNNTAMTVGTVSNHDLNLYTNNLARVVLDAGGSLGVGTTAHSSAILDASSTTKGFLPPRMTTAQRNAVASPTAGLTIYNSDEKGLNYYDGANWQSLNGEVRYIRMAGSGSQTVAQDSIIDFSTLGASNGITASGNAIQLKAGRTYRLEASVDLQATGSSGGNSWLGYRFHNGSGYFGQPSFTFINTASGGDQRSSSSALVEYITPSTDISVTVRAYAINMPDSSIYFNWGSKFVATEVRGGPSSSGGGSADNLGNHTATQNINLSSNWLSGNGGNAGIRIDTSGNVGINKATPTVPLDVVGDIKSSTAIYAPSSYVDRSYSNSQSAATPGFSFTYSNDTGLFEAGSAGSHALGLSTAGSERMRILSTGNVGIGLTNPSEKLEVSGKVKATELCIGADCRAAWPSGAGGTVTSVTSANADIAVATTTTTPVLTLNTGTGANQILKLNASSEIPAVSGVNLTNLNASNLASGTVPAARLPAFTGDVTSTAGTSALTLATVPVSKGGTGVTSFGANKIVGTNGTGTAMTSYSCGLNEVIKFDGSGNAGCASVSTLLGYTPANGSNYVAKAGDTMTGTLNLPSNGLMVGTNQLAVSGGNVGIGTSSPGNLLSVYNSAATVLANFRTGGAYSAVSLQDGTGNVNLVSSAGDFAVQTGVGTEKLRITSGGNVGIGTSFPGQALTVAGMIESTSGGIKFPDGSIQTTSASSGTNNSMISNFPDFILCSGTTGNVLLRYSYSTSPNSFVYTSGFTASSATDNIYLVYTSTGAYSSANNSSGWPNYYTSCVNQSIAQLYAAGKAFNVAKGPAAQWLQSGNNAYYNVGFVGVGTSSPVAPVTLASAASTSTTVGNKENRLFMLNPSVTTDNGAEIVVGTADTNTGRYAAIGTNIKSNSSGQAAGDVYIATKTNTSDTALTPRLTVQSSGNVGIGNSNPTYKLDVTGSMRVSNSAGTAIYGVSNGAYGVYGEATGNYGVYGRSLSYGYGGVLGYDYSGSYYGIMGFNGSSGAWAFYGSGSAYVSGTYQGSDRRLKEHIKPLSSALDVVNKLEGVSFDWKKNSEQARSIKGKDYGFIAQDIEKVLPEVVREIESPAVPANGKNAQKTLNQELGTFKTVEYTRIIPWLSQAIKELYQKLTGFEAKVQTQMAEQQKQMDALKKENDELKKRLDRLERKLATEGR